MSRAAVEQLLYLMDEAFDASQQEHSLLGNLRSVTDAEWLAAPPGGVRSIFEVVQHVGECKYVYDNHAFGDGSMRWDKPGTIPSVEPNTARDDVLDWLRGGQRRLREHAAGLIDEHLIQPRKSNWGQEYETRWLISVMIQHDLYHAGEINHIRGILQGNDRWAYDGG
jgi:uncharacterized damage-inducible protein DinB